MSEKMEKIMRAKVLHINNDLFGGKFIPVEIIELHKLGVNHEVLSEQQQILESAKHDKSNGKCCPKWFYFHLGTAKSSCIFSS